MRLPFPLHVHFIGIGGVGMSGLAEILHSLGYQVTGSDLHEGLHVKRLMGLGLSISLEHAAQNVEGAQYVVVSSAVSQSDNLEVEAALKKNIPILHRAEVLADLMRSHASISVGGSHGKTTTTSLIAHIMRHAGLGPTAVSGGILNQYGTNAWLGNSQWFVAEADESDGSFLKLPTTHALLTTIDQEHVDFYGSTENLEKAFLTFITSVPFYGVSVLGVDSPLPPLFQSVLSHPRFLTYGTVPEAHVQATHIRPHEGGTLYDVVLHKEGRILKDISLPLWGRYNICNATGALSLLLSLGLSETEIREGLASFQGVARRMTETGMVRGIRIIDDYAHHPTEIMAVLETLRPHTHGRLIAVFQPHRPSRLQHLFQQFCASFSHADCVILTDIYAAGEAPQPSMTKDILMGGIKENHPYVLPVTRYPELLSLIADEAKTTDTVVFLGAGSVSTWAHALPRDLASL